jgi:hypothetical protein
VSVERESAAGGATADEEVEDQAASVIGSLEASFNELVDYVCDDDVGTQPVDESPEASVASAAPSSVAAVRAVAPRKDIRPRLSRRQLTADRIAHRWARCPLVSNEAAYGMLTAMPSYSTYGVAAAAQRRLGLSDRHRIKLRRRLSAAAYVERQMVAELQQLLPDDALDGNTAVATVHRLQAWMRRHDQRPPARVNE